MSDTPREARRRLGERARAWIDAALGDFAVAPESEGPLAPIKRNGELATVAALLLDRGEEPCARAWLDLGWSRYGHGQLLARETAAQPGLAAMYPPFRRHGLRSVEVERAIATALPRVRDPALRLVLACGLVSAGLDTPWELGQLLGESFLAREPATWLMSDREAYVITHVVLFLSPVDALGDRHRRYIQRSLPAWIAQFVRAGDLDLVGELIMVAHALGGCVPDCEWQVLVDAQEEDGLVPFRSAWRGREVPARMRFLANYHSTLVACAAAGMCAARCG